MPRSTLFAVCLRAVRRLGLALLLSGVLGGLGAGVQAQVPDDTTDVAPIRRAPAAGPDTVGPEDVGRASADTGASDRALVNADSLSARTRNGERVQELFRNVFVRQDTTRLESEYALRYLTRDELLFTDDVVIYERGDTLRADTVRYNKATKVGRARGRVQLTDGEVTVQAPRATYYADEKRTVFPDSVTLVDSARVLRAQRGTYWSNEKRAEFDGRVRLTDPETYLEADSLTYYRSTERSVADGDVFIRRQGNGESTRADTAARTYLFGDWVDNQEQRRYSRVEGRALLVRVRMDSTGTPEDTLVVRAHRLDAIRTDTHRRVVAIDSVRSWQRDLAAVADSAVYDRVVAPGPADPPDTPAPLPERSRDPPSDPRDPLAVLPDSLALADPLSPRGAPVPADSQAAVPPPPTDSARAPAPDSARADSTFRSEEEGTRAEASPGTPDSVRSAGTPAREGPSGQWGRPVADSAAALPLEETRLFGDPVTWVEHSQVWGDSIRVRAHDRSLDTVFVRGRAFTAQRDTTLDRIHQLKGRTLTAFFQEEALQRIRARPNARAIRFLEEDGALSGAVRASGDSIIIRFRDGAFHRFTTGGGVESTAYQKPDFIPDPFRLDGFQWTPDRRPTQDEFLQEDRVRRRLGPRRRPPIVGVPGADTLAARSAGDGRSTQNGPRPRTPATVPPADTVSAAPKRPISPGARPLPADSTRAASPTVRDTTRQPLFQP